ncbi:TOMM precursor leader peptide-binding protein [Spirulina sp. 06S082]|uniref:TOMM precursor leader peptide-binding protein n=1 Tax=Spirulina sp. 06S082 TaxID=3110248 RepID=UPI002B20B708|nr:TOMM precursor leader peptide-binding protein [Spirulina sp. 06S082]MEA5472129.1 TOMM precursor leader peptide-binding protein [Spirulina sp. 06S082]
MIEKPKFKNSFRVETVEGESAFLLSERGTILLSDVIYQKLIPLIDGTRSQEEIVAQLRNEIPETYIYFALMELQQKGLLVENEGILPPNITLLCEYLNVKPEDAKKRLKSIKVAVKTLGSLHEQELTDMLASLHIQIAEPADIEIILTDDYLHPEIEAINQTNLQTSIPWMLVKPIGTLLWIGPIFQPHKTACWECLAQRLRNNQPTESFIRRRRDKRSPLTPPLVDLPVTRQTALTMVANELLKWILQGENKRLENAIATYDPLSLSLHNHSIVKRPQCPHCGFLKPQKRPLPVIIGSRKKKFTTDGGHRCVTPEETLAKYQHHISPITGVVRSLEKLPGDFNSLTHIYRAQHHHLTMFDSLLDLQKNIGGRSAGKGRTDAQAKASGFGEAIERYSSVFQGDEVRIKANYQTLAEKAIHPNACMNFSPAQYKHRHQWNATHKDNFQRVPEPFDESKEIDWTPVWSLTQQDFKYLPTAYCYFGYPKPEKPDCWANTNGCAAGNTIEEAILQGFFELVERDCIALWWYNRLSRPAIALNSFDDPYFQAVSDYYHSLGRELWVLDLTSDLNIPTFGAISRRCDREVEDIIFGFGTHFDPKLALQRALTEIGQVLPAVLLANADGTTRYAISTEPHMLNWWKTATVENQPYLLPDRQVPAKRYSDDAIVWHDDLLADIQYCQHLVEEKGMEMLVLDQTRPDIGLNVVKVIVPGLRLFWKRLDAGRLYDVPVQLGWLKEPIPEDQLNPIPMWL